MTNNRALAFKAIALFLGTSSGTALAQSTIPTPSVRSTVDKYGVDLVSGGLQLADPGVSIGNPSTGGLSHARVWLGTAWTHGYLLSISTTSTGVSVNLGGRSVPFTGSGSFTSATGGADSLVDNGSTYTYTASDGTVITFDKGLVTGGASYYGSVQAVATLIDSPGAERTTLTYRQSSYVNGGATIPTLRLQSVTNSLGYQLKYSYAANSVSGSNVDDWYRMTQVTGINNAADYCDPSADACSGFSQSWPSVTYNLVPSGSNKIEYVAHSGGYARAYTTDANGRMISIKPPEQASAARTYSYDGAGRVAQAVKASSEWNYSWSQSGAILTSTQSSPTGLGIQVISDTSKQVVTSIVDEFSKSTSFNYDSFGRLTKTTAPEGNAVEYSYDGRGNITQTISRTKPGTTVNGSTGLVTNAAYPTTCGSPATCNKPTSVTDARGHVTDFTYNASGQLLTATGPAANGVRPQVRHTYATKQAFYKNSAGSIVASGVNVSKLVQTARCRTASSCAGTADEMTTSIDYGAQSAGSANNLLPVSIARAGNGLTATIAMAYEWVGNLSTVDGPLAGTNDTMRYRYESDRSLSAVIYADPDGSGGRPRVAMRMYRNQDGNISRTDVGTVASLSDADFAAFSTQTRREFTYDSYGLVATEGVLSANGSQQYQVTQTLHDVLERPICTVTRMSLPINLQTAPSNCGTAGQDRTTHYYYSGFDRISSVVAASGTASASTTSLAYSDNGQTTSMTDPNNNRTAFEYDGVDRLLKTSYPATSKGSGVSSSSDYEQLGRDQNGNVTSRRLRDGNNIYYGYDALNRLTSKDRPNLVTGEGDQTFAYDLLGRLTSAVDTNGQTVSFGYDGLGRRTTEGHSSYGTTTSNYDVAGRRTRLTWPDGFYVDYDYDAAGNMTAVKEYGAGSGVGLLASYGYDTLGRRSSVTRGNGAVTSYAYDGASRIASLAHDLAGTGYDITRSFTYNPAGQIASLTTSNSAYNWGGYTALNRSYTTNGLNQYSSAGGVGFGYDGRGNLTSSGSSTYGHTSENQLATSPNSNYSYDALGTLTYQSASDIGFGHDGTDLVFEKTSSSGAVLRRYVFGAGVDEPIVWYEGSGTGDRRWLHADERGSVVSVTNSSGAASNVNSYDEYGIPASGNVGRFQYTGQAWLPELGMYHYKARTYSPSLGRFLQTDPAGYPDGPNWYNYVRSDPLNRADPSGMDDSDTITVVGQPGCSFWCRSALSSGISSPFMDGFTRDLAMYEAEVRGQEALCRAEGGTLTGSNFPSPGQCEMPQKSCPSPPTPGPGKAELNRNIRNARNDRPGSRAGPQGGGIVNAWRLKRDVTGSQNYKANPNYGDPGARFGNFNYGANAAARGFSIETTLRASDAFDRWENLWEEGDPFTGDDPRDVADVTNGYNYVVRGCDKR